jgi:hypothetical protein
MRREREIMLDRSSRGAACPPSVNEKAEARKQSSLFSRLAGFASRNPSVGEHLRGAEAAQATLKRDL